MNLDLTEDQKLLQKSVREFAEAEVKPLASENDETGRFPRETISESGGTWVDRCGSAGVRGRGWI